MKPFTVNISETVLSDLKNRIKNTRWPGEADGSDWHFGTSEKYLKEFGEY